MNHDDECQCSMVQCRRYKFCGAMDRACTMVPARRVHPGFRTGRFCEPCARLLGWRPPVKVEPRKKPHTVRELRELADQFHHPEPVPTVSGLYRCATCELPLYYNKRKGWCHERVIRQSPVTIEIEGQLPLF